MPARESGADGQDLWAYATRHVIATIDAENVELPARPDSMRVEFVSFGDWDVRPENRLPDPWNDRWMRAHGLAKRGQFRWVRGTHEYAADVPAIKNVVAQARAGDLRSEPVTIQFPSDPTLVARVHLRLRRDAVVSGIVTDTAGNRVAGATVECYATRILAPGESLDISRQRLDGRGGTVTVSKGVVTSTRIWSTVAASDGTFSTTAPYLGSLTIVVRAPGHPPTRREIGALGSPLPPVTVVVDEDRGALPKRIRVTSGGAPFQSATFIFSDVTVQPEFACTLATDEAGFVSSIELIAGHSYWITAVNARRPEGATDDFLKGGIVLAAGADQVDLSKATMDVERFLSTVR